MTRKEAKRRAELYSALAEGKKIQFNQENGEWADLTMELIEVLSESAFRYRIKPEPKYRPFNSQEECWNEMLKHQPFGWLKEKEARSDIQADFLTRTMDSVWKHECEQMGMADYIVLYLKKEI